MANCDTCYHLIENEKGEKFCYAEGFISINKTPLNECPYYIDKNKTLQPCPDCNDIHRKKSDFCKNCKILKELHSMDEQEEKNERIGKYSILEMESMNNEIQAIEEVISSNIAEIIQKFRNDLINGTKPSHYYEKITQKIELLERELSITKEIVMIDELVNNIMSSINKVIRQVKENNRKEFSDEMDLLKIENKLSMQIIKLESKITNLIDEYHFEESDKILNDLREISNHLKKLEDISEVKEIQKKFIEFRDNIVKI